ncbi:Fur-regulated basic protein FbpA [Evansella tamaricis]|uniref:Fur-regulated basic protein FbpA n=1 Tax=Evansella tamaricis TaxID=2069301 RepID=UPI003642C42C
MSKYIQEAIKLQKTYLINQLIRLGTYKKGDLHLYELTLTELQEEYDSQMKQEVTMVNY